MESDSEEKDSTIDHDGDDESQHKRKRIHTIMIQTEESSTD